MNDRLDDARTELLAKAAAVAGRLGPVPDVADFLERFYRHVPAEDLVGRDPVDVYGAAASHVAVAELRPQGTATVRVHTPTVDADGWSTGHTVVEVVIDDMPFLVDSVTMELTRQERGIHLVIHPQLLVRRDVVGRLDEVLPVDPARHDSRPGATVEPGTEGAVVEAWIHVEIDRETHPDDLRQIERSLLDILRDVRECVEDWPRMRRRAEDLADELARTPSLPLPDEEVAEAEELLRWLADEHFTFLGYREYLLDVVDGEDVLRAVTATGLGILRSDQAMSGSFAKLPPEARARARQKRLLILTKANSRSTVHRPAYLDYVSVKNFGDEGEVIGERRFLGLFTSATYTQSVLRIPVLRRRAQQVLALSGYPPSSHSGKDLLQVLETYPRDELFQSTVEELLETARQVLHLQERRRLRLFVRRDSYGRFLSCLVYLPRDRYNTAVRLTMQDILLKATGGANVDYTARISESVLARLHFVIRMPAGQVLPQLDLADLEQRLAAATHDWSDEFTDAVIDQVGEEQASRLLRRYGNAFPEAYKEDFPARTAVADLRRFEELDPDDGLAMNLYHELGAPASDQRFKIYRTGAPISLTQVLPILTRAGVEVVDERPYEITPPGVRGWIYDFGLRLRGPAPMADPVRARELFQDAFSAVWAGRCESDGFNALVLVAGVSWRQATVLRAYAKYLRQAGSTFSQAYIEECLVAHPEIARLLVRLFEERFDPDLYGAAGEGIAARTSAAAQTVREVETALDAVASLDQDRILRGLLTLLRATQRTNWFRTDEAGEPRAYLSVKLDPRMLPDLPRPRPRFEIWVYSPRVEGVHLRFGAVARGGLRWSDRREDFRTEILGLAKAQAVKNAVIVPVGAKGGFVAKRLPDPAVDREAWLAEGIECYQTLVRGLLDITDNRAADRTVVPPDRVVRHDGDDPYLVVAADKGTATFSDIANQVSADYGFWLGDAFASGGSVGYDHKVMGITARGAWESVKRHFRELGRDCQQQDFTCVGIGDMSGDVFGNGMLLSRHTRLVAAFDHRHVFLDPDPDPELSWLERKRLFDLPRSSWADYDPALISAGGGVHSRAAKSVDINPQVRAVLGLPDDVSSLPPAELIRAVLQAPVDLLWNGGIGTYVKASTETHFEVGDKATDTVRVDAAQLRAAIVGEGGNLGFTQRGRVEYALAGGRINTDAIDNSAGVDTSDHEVNIKILLDDVVRDGDLTEKQRHELLVEMTDEVASLVLQDNYGQNVAIAQALAQAPALLHVHAAYLRHLERAGLLDRTLEALPTDRQLTERRQRGIGLVGPEFAVLLAYTKNTLFDELLESTLPEEPFLADELRSYFPAALRERFPVDGHPLRREIITTCLVNNLVNTAGSTFAYRLGAETGASVEDLARAQLVARVVFDMAELWQAIDALDHQVPAEVQTRMRLEGRTITERATRWLVSNRRPPIDVARQIEFFDAPLSRLIEELPSVLCGREDQLYEQRLDGLLATGVPQPLAQRFSVLSPAYAGLGMVETAVATGADLIEVARVHFALGDRIGLGLLLERIVALPRTDRWQVMARAALRDDLHALHAGLTAQVLAATPEGADAAARVGDWEERDAVMVARTRKTMREVLEDEAGDLARLSVGLRVVRALLRTGASG